MELLGLLNKGWALRYLREARAELVLARESTSSSQLFSLEAAKKAQACIHHCLGNPRSIEMLVFDAMLEERRPDDKVIELLLAVERMVQMVADADDPADAYRLAAAVVELASKVVEGVFGEGGR